MLKAIRKLEPQQVHEIRKRIKPIQVNADGEFVLLDVSDVDPIKSSYNWMRNSLRTTVLKDKLLLELKSMSEFPTTGYYGFFKPSEEEVLNLIPDDLFEKVSYYIIHTEAVELSSTANHQRCVVSFYSKEK